MRRGDRVRAEIFASARTSADTRVPVPLARSRLPWASLQCPEECDEVDLLRGIADRYVRHALTWDQSRVVCDPISQVIFGPNEARLLERVRIGEPGFRPSEPPDHAVKRRAVSAWAPPQHMADKAVVEEDLPSRCLFSLAVRLRPAGRLRRLSEAGRCGGNDCHCYQGGRQKISHGVNLRGQEYLKKL